MDRSKSTFRLITVSFLVLGNCLGVGVLALPIKSGLTGFWPALVGIIAVWFIMLMSAFVIGYKINIKKSNTFDIPSFYAEETNQFGKWVAIACNLILLYGVLVAYLSGMTAIIRDLIPVKMSDNMITLIYFAMTTTLILFGSRVMRRGNLFIVTGVWICFFFLVGSGLGDFEATRLASRDWAFFPIGLPVAVSAFHFHNIIPTVSRSLNHDVTATRKAIFIGVGLGLAINLIWVIIVLGTMQRMGVDPNTIEEAYWHNLPATVPMNDILHSHVFEVSGFVFAMLAVTASYIANGTGLYGFLRDICHNHLKLDSQLAVAALAFLPPLVVAIVYPNIFLSALDVVGGVGESVLFIILPGWILLKKCRRDAQHAGVAFSWFMIVTGTLITIYVFLDKAGVVDLVPAMPN